jgi:hypothetical protein
MSSLKILNRAVLKQYRRRMNQWSYDRLIKGIESQADSCI